MRFTAVPNPILIRILFGVSLLLLVFWQQARAETYTWQTCRDKSYSGYKVPEQDPDDPDLDATTFYAGMCGLDKLIQGSFDYMPNLEKILLYKNKLTTFPETVFKNVHKVTELDVSENRLEYMPQFGYYSLFPQLKTLVLNNNRIKGLCHLNTFSSTAKLEELNLDSNEIGYIHPDIFKPLVNLKKLTLSNNQVAYISDKMFQIKTLEEVFLNNNFIQYVAPDAFLGTKLRMLWLQENRLTYLSEHFLMQLKKSGSSISSFPLSNNPWQCRCLWDILEDITKLGIRDYSSYYYHGSSPACVTDNAVQCIRTSKEKEDVTINLLEHYLSKIKLAKSCIY